MKALLMFLGPVFELSTSYKTIERLYSDDEVELVLYNLMVLLRENRGVSGHTAGDGTGYLLHAGGHYRADPARRMLPIAMSFDLSTLKQACTSGMAIRIPRRRPPSERLFDLSNGKNSPWIPSDWTNYYSSRKNLRVLGQDVEAFIIPKDIASFGTEWREVIERIAEDQTWYLEEYYKRELTESYFAADKERFGREIHQIREDRREMTAMGLTVLHNLFSVRVTSD